MNKISHATFGKDVVFDELYCPRCRHSISLIMEMSDEDHADRLKVFVWYPQMIGQQVEKSALDFLRKSAVVDFTDGTRFIYLAKDENNIPHYIMNAHPFILTDAAYW
ncbi:MAG: hypothetical protein SFW66_08975 [Gammaproteobacteria bacterium]|nr:hypothetical protein [Gammaproteobacteria bacterium]